MRLSQALHFLNQETLPTVEWMSHHYTHLSVDVREVEVRREYQKKLSEVQKDPLFGVPTLF